MTEKVRIAVIGAGAAGTYAAFSLRKQLGSAADITIYERNEHAGGRAWDLTFAGTRIEVGGTLLHSSGKYGYELMEFTGSKEGVPGLSVDGDDETYAFWTDKGFPVFTKTTLASMAVGIVRHVGPKSALKVTNTARDMSVKWERVYDVQGSGQRFNTVEELLGALDLADVASQELRTYLKSLKVNDRMAEDIIEAIIHNMYNQGLEMNAFAGLVGLAGAGLAGGRLFAIEDGNWTLFQRTIDSIDADVRLETTVTRIDATKAEGAAASFVVSTDDGNTEAYDLVVLAAPPALSGIEVSLNGADAGIPNNPYQQVYTTFIVGDLNPAYFHAASGAALPSTIFTADSAGAPFKSIGVTGYSPDYDSRIYKIFSAEHKMTEEELQAIFVEVKDVREFIWEGAYPKLTTSVEHVPFEIFPGLYFANALETAAGSIEVEAVSGANASFLAADYAKEALLGQ